MSLPRLGYRETVAYVFRYCLRWLTLGEASCHLMRQIYGETHRSEFGSISSQSSLQMRP